MTALLLPLLLLLLLEPKAAAGAARPDEEEDDEEEDDEEDENEEATPAPAPVSAASRVSSVYPPSRFDERPLRWPPAMRFLRSAATFFACTCLVGRRHSVGIG